MTRVGLVALFLLGFACAKEPVPSPKVCPIADKLSASVTVDLSTAFSCKKLPAIQDAVSGALAKLELCPATPFLPSTLCANVAAAMVDAAFSKDTLSKWECAGTQITKEAMHAVVVSSCGEAIQL